MWRKNLQENGQIGKNTVLVETMPLFVMTLVHVHIVREKLSEHQ